MQINRKRFLQNLFLLCLVLGLAYFIATREESREQSYETLYDESIGKEVTEITIHVEGQDDVILQNKDEQWSLVKPIESIADSIKVQQLFTLLSENANSRYSIKDKNLADYGLEKDRLSIRFNHVALRFGNLNEVTQQRYILKGENMYLVSETVSMLMRSGADGFKLK